jgi:hypothetical protein
MKRFLSVAILLYFDFVLGALYAQGRDSSAHFLGTREPLTAASARPATQIARDYLAGVASQLNLTETDLAGLYVSKEYKTQHNGVTHLVYKQQFRGIDVLNAAWVVNVDADGRVLNAGGSLYGVPAPDLVLPSNSSALAAVRAAAREVNPKLGEVYAPFASDKPAHKRNGLRFASGGFAEDIQGEPVWYAVRGLLHTAWLFYIVDADGINSFATVVDDATQLVLDKQPMTFFQQAPKGLVFERESPQPNPTPGVRLTGPPPLVQRTLQPFTGDPIASPKGWVTDGETVGNNAIVGENPLGITFLLTPKTAKAATNDFSFPLELGAGAPNPINFADAASTNLFYWINRAHDLHYQSGFDEAAGNFQQDNFGRGGVGGDPIYAYSHFGANSQNAAQIENAFFTTRVIGDGAQSMVAMFLSASNQGDFFTDGSYDAVVMVHEYTHGVSNRLVQNGYSTFQGAAMGEAWSDFYGLEYTLPEGAPPDGFYAPGEYFDQDWGAGDLRTRGYSTNIDLNPLTYANLGHVIPEPEVHADGEIWFEALWEMRANLIQQLGEKEGRRRVRLLVMDGMKMSIPAPSMVDMRDAILLADRADFKGASQDQIWTAFAKRGLGALAFATSGDSVHVISSFEKPSSTGQLKFYDNPFVIGEPVRIVLQDSSYTQPTATIQLTSSSGDLENVVLKKTGSIYAGIIGTTAAATARFSGALSVVPGDSIAAYYGHFGPPGPNQQISTYVDTIPPYTFSTTAPSFTFGTETALRLTGTNRRVNLPFAFPFFANKYSSAFVYRNGLITFDFPVTFDACTDTPNLAFSTGIAPLYLNLSVTGQAQPREDVYMSQGSDSVTFHWVGETRTPFTGVAGSPVNFAATLFSDGRIEFHYGSGNQNLAAALTSSGCGPGPTVGISNGHEFYTSTLISTGFDSASTVHFDPPFGYGSLPVIKLESPTADQHFQGILQVTGVAYDPQVPISRIDVFIDGMARARTTPTVSRPDFCSTQNVRGCPLVGFSVPLDITALGLANGPHTLQLQATNTRGAFVRVPDSPVTFNVDSGQSRLPYGKIESPADGDKVSGNVLVKGYMAADDLRITGVDTLIDGVTYGPTQYGVPRTDICNALSTKPPNCPNIGFQLTLVTQNGFPPIPDGKHSMQIRVRDETGRFTLVPDTPIAIIVENGAAVPIIGVLESPKTNDRLSGTIHMSGYAYSPGDTITSGSVIADNFYSYGSIRYGVARPEVCATLPDVSACPNIGFTFDLDTRLLSNGPHTLGILLFNKHGDQLIIPNLVNGGINVFIEN